MAHKILFLVPYPLKESPSQRFRFEQYFSALHQHDHQYEVQSFLDSQNWQLFFKEGHAFSKFKVLLLGYLYRIYVLLRSSRYDRVFIHREAAPIGPPIIEWIIAKVLRKKIIYDYDDAIWLTDRRNESFMLKSLKWRSKVASICRWSYKISCGNAYLAHYASQFNNHVVYNPTTVDTDTLHNRDLFTTARQQEKIIIGWTGSHSTLKYLNGIESVLQKLEAEYSNISIVVIADKKPDLALKSLRFVRWNMDTETQDLLTFDIGLMPLPDDEWANGKCGFKILQYLALCIPAVASPVGVNTAIIQHGKTGYLCTSENDWYKALKTLIENRSLRNSFGAQGREFIKARYSVASNTSNFLDLFE